MLDQRVTAIRTWFASLNEGRLDEVIDLFHPGEQRIKNAAAPVVTGPQAAFEVLSEFLVRTSSRRFTVQSIATGRELTFAWWVGELAFADGAVVAGRVVEPFTARTEGIDVFAFDDEGRITSVDIVHETSTVTAAAVAHTKET